MAGAARSALGVGALALAIALVSAAAASAVPAGFTQANVAVGLDQPTGIGFLPDGGLLVAEKGGALKLVRGGSASTLWDFHPCTDKSMGLLGVLVDPAFASNGFVYVYRTRPPGSDPANCGTDVDRVNEVVRIELAGDAVVPGSEQAIFSGIRTDNGQHNGGTLRIGPDGKLYVSTGDTGLGDFPAGPPGTSTNPFAQDLGELPGKVLRLNLDGSPAPGNPFAGLPGARPEIFAYGFRNPFRFGVDPETGRLWLGDVGQLKWEELNVVVPGGNYGWPDCEGTEGNSACPPPAHVEPAFAYDQNAPGSLGASITGGAFAPCAYGAYGGQYIFGDYAADRLYHATPNAARSGLAGPPAVLLEGADGPVEIAFGPDGALYYVAIKVGQVRRVSTQAGSCTVRGAPGAGGGTARPPAVTADRVAPRHNLRYRRRQPADRVSISIRPDEPAALTVTATVSMRGSTRTYRFKRVRRVVPTHKRSVVRLALSRGSLKRVRRAVVRKRLLKARVKLTLIDSAGNVSRAQARIRLLR